MKYEFIHEKEMEKRSLDIDGEIYDTSENVCVCIWVCVDVCVYERHREKKKERDRYKERVTENKPGKDRERQTEQRHLKLTN